MGKKMMQLGVLALAPSAVCGFTAGAAPAGAVAAPRAAVNMGFYDHSAVAIDGSKVDMSSYKGKPVLILNVASL
jgi:hypothetical protein